MKESADPLENLRTIMACLRHKEYGCPWDLEQTPKSIAPYTIEEAYEVVDAIEGGSIDHLKEELGDLLLQVVFYCQMAEEKNQFTLNDVAEGISEKLLRRHPHVFPNGDIDSFGQVSAIQSAQEVEKVWEKIKKTENVKPKKEGVLSGVERGISPMKRAIKMQKAAGTVGFDWKDVAPALGKVEEETNELKEAIDKSEPSEKIEEEFGDLLFASMNVARFLKFDPEMALIRANRKFEARFKLIEKHVAASGKGWDDFSLKELDVFWEKAKLELYQTPSLGLTE
ncbi:MAG: nucleoside triphosphate pyrophosphohydrolase [Pseudomonadales bacterium]|nr:nucleoside triphosphate pyrophosphohydrolase [Pseudomonadales bacterium]